MLSEKTLSLKNSSDNDRSFLLNFLESLKNDLLLIYSDRIKKIEIIDNECLDVFIDDHYLIFYLDDVDVYLNNSLDLKINIQQISGYNKIISILNKIIK